MRPRLFSLVATSALLLAAFPMASAPAQEAEPAPAACVKAGYGEADTTWNVGAPAGQHASSRNPSGDAGGMDPYAHQVTRNKSYGVQSRLTTRAIVVEGCNGELAVLVKNDNYLAQDLMQRRVGQLLAERGSRVAYEDILVAASHNHSSPYQMSPSWGLAVFQDTFDARMLEWHARRTTDAIMAAEDDLRAARMSATEVKHEIFKGNVVGTPTADDGTPAGYPRSFGDLKVVVMRFDDAQSGKPIATWVNFGQHPESLDTTDLITADYLGALERFVGRETGAPVVFAQGDVGSAEGPNDGSDNALKWLPDGTRRTWYQVGFAHAERGARYLADSIIEGFNRIGAGDAVVPYSSDFTVGMYDAWIPGPLSHPYPAVWNCKTEENLEGRPRLGVAPTCEEGPEAPWSDEPENQMIWESLKQRGVPAPDQVGGPAFGAVEENNRLRLQAVRLGDVILGSCACEAQVDLILNFESRADDKVGNIWDGYDWNCRPADHVYGEGDPNAERTWTCDLPTAPGGTRDYTFSDYEYARMQAEIHNDAEGWNDPAYAPFANSQPYDPAKIKGNFTKEELNGDVVAEPDDDTNVLGTTGYKLAVGVGHAGDYNGYTVSYREFQNRDHYRKALTAYGPHTADYMSTHLVYMAQALKGGPDVIAEDPYYDLQAVDEARQVAFSEAAGRSIGAAYDAWYRALPSEAQAGTALSQPKDIQRFDAATFTWSGGSNAIDNPVVVVQRKVDGDWKNYADQTGEVQTFLEFPAAVTGAASTYGGQERWEWTANFEAFNFGPRRDIDPRGDQVPEGEYRFVVEGRYRDALEDRPYRLESDPFEVSKWEGIAVQDLQKEATGVSFSVTGTKNAVETTIAPGHKAPEIRYPRTYTPHPIIRYIRDDGRADICETCSFRPWAAGSDVAGATVTVVRADGSEEQVAASRGADGRWHAAVALYEGDRAFVARGGIVDTFGEINGARSGAVEGSGPRPDPDPTEEDPAPTVTTLSYTGSTSGQYSDQATLQATLVDAEGDPVEAKDIVFELTGTDSTRTFEATTDSAGVATADPVLTERPGPYQLTARFSGDETHVGAADTTMFVVEREDTALELTVSAKGKDRTLTARLWDADTPIEGLEGRDIAFFADGQAIGSAVTDARGVATLEPPARYRGGKYTFEARFEGDDFYREASASTNS